ncbi:MAG: class I SAM-dependent methyltransferase [Bryobacteraceae bacterium]
MQPAEAGLEQLKQKMRSTWMAGDFGQIARYSKKEAAAFVGRLGIKPGATVLDVACGTGNLSIPAALLGAKVTGADIATNLLDQARKRAAEENLDATFDEGDAEKLPYADGQFDSVITMFGAMFAPRPERAAAELIRVCKPGGLLAMANWTPKGFAGKMFALGARFAPPPAGVPAPVLWGDETTLRARLAEGTSEIRTTLRMMDMAFPFPPAEVVELFRRYFGPVHMAFARLDPQKQTEYAAELEKLWIENNEAEDGKTLARGEYLEVIATRA